MTVWSTTRSVTCVVCGTTVTVPDHAKAQKLCGARACRLARLRATNAAREAKRKAAGVKPRVRTRQPALDVQVGRYGRKRYRLQCVACGIAFWTTDPRQQTHDMSCAAQARNLARFGRRAAAPRTSWTTSTDPYTGESSDRIEAAFRQARAARLAREKATGQRTYTITNPWAQRADYVPFGRDGGEDGW